MTVEAIILAILGWIVTRLEILARHMNDHLRDHVKEGG